MGGPLPGQSREGLSPSPRGTIAHVFPPQGTWSEEEYLELETNHFVEFSDGNIEVLPMPTVMHQLIAAYLFKALDTFVDRKV